MKWQTYWSDFMSKKNNMKTCFLAIIFPLLNIQMVHEKYKERVH